MVAKIKKWGNSLALRIPKALAEEAGLTDNAVVEVKLKGGKLVISPPALADPTLEELLAQVTPETLHPETDWGPRVGAEEW
jgi:antitoxin MazE